MSGVRVLIVDDSPLFRGVVKRILRSIPDVGPIEIARDGVEALEKIKNFEPNIVLLDLEMPRLGGIGTLRIARKRFPESDIIMISGTSGNAADLTMRALEAGALDFICKPTEDSADASDQYLRSKLEPFVVLAATGAARAKRLLSAIESERDSKTLKAVPPAQPQKSQSLPVPMEIVAIGASTGAPGALAHVIPDLPRVLPVPIIVIIHLPAAFSRSLAKQLSTRSEVPVKVAADGDDVKAGTVFLAPGDRHIRVVRERDSTFLKFQITDEKLETGYRPSIDVFLQSMSTVGVRCLSVMMTGMGCDGTKGVKALKSVSGNYCVVQSSDTCVVSSMPDSVKEAGLADEVVPLDGLAERIVRLIGM